MSTPVAKPHPTPVAPPTGCTVVLNTDGTMTITRSAATITLASREEMRQLALVLMSLAN